jgi:hypothetical protein
VASRAVYARFAPAPVPVPPAFTGLPDRDTVSNATPSWGIPQKVECRFACTGLWAQRRTRPVKREADHASFVTCECFLNAPADVSFPSWVFPRGHPHVTGALFDKSGAPAEIQWTDLALHSNDTPRSVPPS